MKVNQQIEETMNVEEYFEEIRKLYLNARHISVSNKEKYDCSLQNIYRGRSHSISSLVEDLTALFISMNNPKKGCEYFTDQIITYRDGNTNQSIKKCPDIMIQNEDKTVDHLIDVKTDLGWNRSRIKDFCEEWDDFIENMKNKEIKFKTGFDHLEHSGTLSKHLHYHILVITSENSGKEYTEIPKMDNVSLYILSSGIHPNSYKLNANESILKKITINTDEIAKLLENLSK